MSARAKRIRVQLAGILLVLISSVVLAVKLRTAYGTASFCSDAGLGSDFRYDATVNRCVQIADRFHYTPYGEALDAVFAIALLCLLLGIIAIFQGEPFWPFTVLHRRRYDRAYAAAVVVLVGYYGYPYLSATDQARVDAEVQAQLRLAAEGFPQQWVWYAIGSLRALAMAKLGIDPVAVKAPWKALLKRWPPTIADSFYVSGPISASGKYVIRGFNVMMDYHPFGVATEAAKASLRQAGLQIPEFDPPFDDHSPAQLTFDEAAKGQRR
jgi:hypothetical protein